MTTVPCVFDGCLVDTSNDNFYEITVADYDENACATSLASTPTLEHAARWR
jgi:hypothetical protein